MADSNINFVGEVDVVKIDLVNYRGYRVDIKNLVVELNLFEDIFSNTLSCSLVLSDSSNITEILPIMGEELVIMELSTPTLKERFIKTFYVYKLSDRSLTGTRNQAYTLHLCSKELIASANSKLSKSFSGKVSDVVATILRDEKILGSKKLLISEETKNNYKFIAPYWTPLQTINWLSERALNKNDAANYVFFETSFSFEFVSLEKLMDLPPKRAYVFSNTAPSTSFGVNGDIDKRYSVVSDVYTDVNFDYLRRLNGGFYSSRLHTFDMTSRSISVSSFDYIKDFNKTKHLEKYPITTPDVIRKKVASMYFLEKNDFAYTDKFDQGHRFRLLQRNSLMSQVSAYRLNIAVPGRFDIKAGHTVNFTINSFGEFGSQEFEREIRDDYYTGKYLVTAIRHIIKENRHTMNMEIIKDSFAVPLKTKID